MKKIGKLLLITMGLFCVLLALAAYTQGAIISCVVAAVQAVLFFTSLGIDNTGKRVICIIVGILLIVPCGAFLPKSNDKSSHDISSKVETDKEERIIQDDAKESQETDSEKESEETTISDQQEQNTEETVSRKPSKEVSVETKKGDGEEKTNEQKIKNTDQEESLVIDVSSNTKKIADEYELFYDGYIAFFKDYDSNDPSSLVKSLSLKNSAEEMNERFEKLKKQNNLSPTDLQYIDDVEQRVQEKMKQLDN